MVLLLLLLIPAGLIAPFVLTWHGVAQLVRAGRRSADSGARLRGAALLLGAAAVALYAWGLLHIAGAVLDAEDGGADSSPLRPCRIPGQPERAAGVMDYTVSYVPLGFVCETNDDGDYTAPTLPASINPGVLTLGLATTACATAAATRTRKN